MKKETITMYERNLEINYNNYQELEPILKELKDVKVIKGNVHIAPYDEIPNGPILKFLDQIEKIDGNLTMGIDGVPGYNIGCFKGRSLSHLKEVNNLTIRGNISGYRVDADNKFSIHLPELETINGSLELFNGRFDAPNLKKIGKIDDFTNVEIPKLSPVWRRAMYYYEESQRCKCKKWEEERDLAEQKKKEEQQKQLAEEEKKRKILREEWEKKYGNTQPKKATAREIRDLLEK